MEILVLDPSRPLLTLVSAFVIVAVAELGDKSQLVCMTLAARHRGWPVFLGASAAFAALNALAVSFGAAAAVWLSREWVAALAAALFFGFGLHALLGRAGTETGGDLRAARGRSILATAFLVIFIAEFGDKTQIAVAGLSAAATPLAVWVGATLGLAGSAALAIVAGRTVLQRIPLRLLQRLTGALFLALALAILLALL